VRRRAPMSPLFPYTTLFRSALVEVKAVDASYPMFGTLALEPAMTPEAALAGDGSVFGAAVDPTLLTRLGASVGDTLAFGAASLEDRKSTRLNSSHVKISYAV